MVEPITTNKSMIIPNTGDLSGAWGTSALNPNFQTVDALTGGVTTITLSVTTTLLLSVPATTGVWPGSLSQSVNALIKFTGAQTGSAVIQFTLPGFYIVHNQCTGTTFVQLAPSAGVGNKIGAPPGQKIHVFYDGTDMDYVNMPTPGSALDLHTNTTTLPPWMTACTVSPFLLKDGTVYTASVYPALSQLLGSTYGGNGITTFGVPDERNRFRIGVDPGGATGRVTTAGSGINGAALGTTGGSQTTTLVTANLPPYTPSGSVSTITTIPYSLSGAGGLNNQYAAGSGSSASFPFTGASSFTGTAQGGTSSPLANMPPTSVSMLALIKT